MSRFRPWMMNIGQTFERKWQFSYCIRDVDCKHIVMQATTRSTIMFFNYKEYAQLPWWPFVTKATFLMVVIKLILVGLRMAVFLQIWCFKSYFRCFYTLSTFNRLFKRRGTLVYDKIFLIIVTPLNFIPKEFSAKQLIIIMVI